MKTKQELKTKSEIELMNRIEKSIIDSMVQKNNVTSIIIDDNDYVFVCDIIEKSGFKVSWTKPFKGFNENNSVMNIWLT